MIDEVEEVRLFDQPVVGSGEQADERVPRRGGSGGGRSRRGQAFAVEALDVVQAENVDERGDGKAMGRQPIGDLADPVQVFPGVSDVGDQDLVGGPLVEGGPHAIAETVFDPADPVPEGEAVAHEDDVLLPGLEGLGEVAVIAIGNSLAAGENERLLRDPPGKPLLRDVRAVERVALVVEEGEVEFAAREADQQQPEGEGEVGPRERTLPPPQRPPPDQRQPQQQGEGHQPDPQAEQVVEGEGH